MHFPHLSLVDDWLEEGVVMEVARQPEQPPVSEEAIIEGNHIHDFEISRYLNFAIFLVYLLAATYFVILSDIFVIRHENIFWFICIYFLTNLLNCNYRVLDPAK